MAKKEKAPKKNPAVEKGRQSKTARRSVRMPPLIEFVFNLSGIVTFAVAAAVVFLSIRSGSSWWSMVLKAGIAILGLGLLQYAIARSLVRDWLEESAPKMEEDTPGQPDTSRKKLEVNA